MYGLTAEDLELQGRARLFADELIPHELEAELHDGRLPAGVAAAHQQRAIDLGLYATNMPRSVGGQGCTALQQVLVQEQAGRVTNALGWCMHTPPAWWPAVASDYQRDRWVVPTVRGERHECYAITEEYAGSDVAAIQSTARRRGDTYVLDGEKWHVTSYNEASYVLFQAVLTDGPTCRAAGTVRRRPAIARCPGGAALRRTATHSRTSTRSSPSRPSRFRRPISWVARVTECPSCTSGSASSG